MSILLAAGLDGLTRMVLGTLAVAGAFLIGYVAAMVFLGIGMRAFTRKVIPLKFNKLLRIFAGLAAAILVAMFVFGDGGMGYGAGDGGLPGSGKDSSGPKRDTEVKPDEPKEKVLQPLPKESEKPEGRVRVTVLGGSAVVENRFYLFENQSGGLTLKEVESRVADRRASPGLPLSQIEIYVYQDSSDIGSRAVRDLQVWSTGQGLKVVFPNVQDRMRPLGQ